MNLVKIKKLHPDAILPTYGSETAAGADLYALLDEALEIPAHTTIKIHTGLSMEIPVGYAGFIYARSSMGTKQGLAPANKVGVIDSDYYYSDNEGHIFLKVTNDSNENKIVDIPAGQAFAQGIFVEYGITYDDDADGVRNGGFGSTSK